MFFNVNLRDDVKFDSNNANFLGCFTENSRSLTSNRKREYYKVLNNRIRVDSREYCDSYIFDRIGYSKNINLRLKDIDETTLMHLDIMLFQNPMPLEKVAFLTEVLTPAAIKIQRWYLRHFYRPEGRYVNTVLRNRFNARL